VLRLVVYSWPNATKREVRQVAERRFLIRADEVIEGAAGDVLDLEQCGGGQHPGQHHLGSV